MPYAVVKIAPIWVYFNVNPYYFGYLGRYLSISLGFWLLFRVFIHICSYYFGILAFSLCIFLRFTNLKVDL